MELSGIRRFFYKDQQSAQPEKVELPTQRAQAFEILDSIKPNEDGLVDWNPENTQKLREAANLL